MKSNLFIVGTPKAGTTALYEYLRNSKDVFLPSIKETNYFAHSEISKQRLYYNAPIVDSRPVYDELYASATHQKWLVDASVSYLYYEPAATRIFEYNPEARIIIILRNPAERAYSHYLMDKRLGFIKSDFAVILNRKQRDHQTDVAYQQFVSLGFYHDQVKRYMDIFPHNQIRIFFHHEVKSNRKAWLNEVCQFLDIEPLSEEATSEAHNAHANPKNGFIQFLYQMKWLRKAIKAVIPAGLQKGVLKGFFDNSKPALDPEIDAQLRSLYKNDIQKLEALFNKNLMAWYE
ncbi:MAG: sulfotransferase family protein [Flavobacteriales bacterium]